MPWKTRREIDFSRNSDRLSARQPASTILERCDYGLGQMLRERRVAGKQELLHGFYVHRMQDQHLPRREPKISQTVARCAFSAGELFLERFVRRYYLN